MNQVPSIVCRELDFARPMANEKKRKRTPPAIETEVVERVEWMLQKIQSEQLPPPIRLHSVTREDRQEAEMIVMRGVYKIVHGFAYIRGMWNFNHNITLTNICDSKFSYKSEINTGVADESIDFVNGFYSGGFYFESLNHKRRRVTEKKVSIEFTREEEGEDTNARRFKVKGHGKNSFGRFVLDGRYNSSDFSIILYKKYIS